MFTTKHPSLIFITSISILLLLITQDCSNSVQPTDKKDNNVDTLYSSTHFLWPAKLGNFWDFTRYRFDLFNTDENWSYNNFTSFGLNFDSVKSKYSYKLQIVDTINIVIADTLYAGHVFNKIVNKEYSLWSHPYWIGIEGVFNLGVIIDKDFLFKKCLYLPKILDLNKKWKSNFFGKLEGKLESVITENECLSNNEKLTVFADNFQCYVIRTRYREADDYPGYVDFYKYYTPNIGLVLQVKLFVVPNKYWNLEYVDVLNNYKITN